MARRRHRSLEATVTATSGPVAGSPPRRTVPSGRRTEMRPRAGWRSAQRAARRASGVSGERRAGGSGLSARRAGAAAGSGAVCDPSPGTNRGLWWNGTLFIASFTACQWMRPVTCCDISG